MPETSGSKRPHTDIDESSNPDTKMVKTNSSITTESSKSEPNTSVKREDTDNINYSTNIAVQSKTNGGIALALPKIDDKKKAKKANSGAGVSNTGKTSTKSGMQVDPNKMQDVLFSAGVDVREEEALLHTSINVSKSQAQLGSKIPKHPPFLHPDQVIALMRKISKEQNFSQNPLTKDNDVPDMLSSACENYLRDIITNALIVSRHRRKAVRINSGRRSEVSIALKNIAMTQKKEEERRVKKRIALGLEKEDLENKIDSEETLHRASNVTAGLRAGSKKQYGWLTSSVGKPTSTGVKSTGMVASDIAARGDSGLRFREAREEPGIVMRDLLYALENKRNATNNVITKGYARIRD